MGTRYSRAVLASNPVTYYEFDEVSGLACADSSGNGHTGTATALAVRNVMGGFPVSRGIQLNNAADTARAQVTAAASAFNPAGGDMAIDCWVYLTIISGFSSTQLATWVTADSAPLANHFYIASPGHLGMGFSDGTGGNAPAAGAPIDINEWWHVAISYDSTDEEASFYYNGVLDSVVACTNGTTAATNNTVRVGGIPATPAWFGIADDVALYEHTLSASEVAAHFGAGRQYYANIGRRSGLRPGASIGR